MDIYIRTKFLKDIGTKLVVISVRGSGNDIYFQDHKICTLNEVYKENNQLFEKAIKFINESLIKNAEFSINKLNIIGDIYYLPYNEYMAKRSSGKFYDFSPYLKKGTELHNSCEVLYEYIRGMKGVHITFNEWGTDKDGFTWAKHQEIKEELGTLSGSNPYNVSNTFDDFMEIL